MRMTSGQIRATITAERCASAFDQLTMDLLHSGWLARGVKAISAQTGGPGGVYLSGLIDGAQIGISEAALCRYSLEYSTDWSLNGLNDFPLENRR